MIGVAVALVGSPSGIGQQIEGTTVADQLRGPAGYASSAAPAMPAMFAQNCGQWESEARHALLNARSTAGFHDDRMTISRPGADGSFALAFVGAATNPSLDGVLPGYLNFMDGLPHLWRSRVPIAASIRYERLWPDVDVVVRDRGGDLEYDIELSPGGDLSLVAFRPEGVTGMRIEADGSLVLSTPIGDVVQAMPTTWEVMPDGSRHEVPCRYVLRPDGAYGFEAVRAQAELPMVVDPVIRWASYFSSTGSYGSVQIDALEVDAAGNVYVGGVDTSGTPPLTPGAYRTGYINCQYGGGMVAKLDPQQSGSAQLVWGTYFGGSGQDGLLDIAVGPGGEVVLGGFTLRCWQNNYANPYWFPTTPDAFAVPFGSSSGGYAAVLSADGANLLYSSVISVGGAYQAPVSTDFVAVDEEGIITLAMQVAPSFDPVGDLPTTPGAYQAAQSAYSNLGTQGQDLWFGRLDRRLSGSSQLVWGTYFGSTNRDELRGAEVSGTRITFTGWCHQAQSLAPGAVVTGTLPSETYQQVAFVGQLDWSETGPAQRKFLHLLGHPSNEVWGEAMALAPDGDVVVAGGSYGTSAFPWTPGAFRTTGWGFAARFAPNGTLRSATLLPPALVRAAVAVGPDNSVTVIGSAAGQAMPISPDAMDPTSQGHEMFVLQLDAALSTLLYGTYVGGTGDEFPGRSSRYAHLNGNVLTLGIMSSTSDLPLVNAFQPNFNVYTSGGSAANGYVIRFELARADGNPPEVTIGAPFAGAVVGSTSVALTADVVDESETTVTSTPAGISASLPAGGGAVSGVVSLPDEGPNTLAVNATDASGNVGGTSVTVIRDTIAPAVTVDSPAPGAVSGASVVSVSITVVDATATAVTIGTDSVQFAAGGGQASVAIVLAEGANAIPVTATDAAGNVTVVVRDVFYDSAAPLVTITAPSDGATFGAGEASIGVDASVSDASATTVTSDPEGVSGGLPTGGGTVSGSVSLVEGVNTITVSATDVTARTGQASISVVLDTTPPLVSIVSPGAGTAVRGTVDLHVSAVDVLPGTGVSAVHLLVDGNPISILSEAPYETEFDTTTLADGLHVFSATAADGKNNSASASVQVLVDNTAPNVAIPAPAQGAVVAGNVTFVADAWDAGSGVASVVMLGNGDPPTIDGSSTHAPAVAAVTDTSTVATALLPDGTLLLTATVQDAAGNSASASVTVVVDNSAPEKALITPADGAVVSGLLTIEAAASDPNLALLSIWIEDVLIQASSTSPLAVVVDTATILDGPISITVRAIDVALNESACTATVTVDNIPSFRLTPQTLNLKSKGGENSVTAHLEGGSVGLLIPTESHGIELRVPGASPVPSTTGFAGDDQTSDSDQDGIPELIIKFDRQKLANAIKAGVAAGMIAPNSTVTVTLLSSGRVIGTDVIRIIGP
jgi:hypothetical protein